MFNLYADANQSGFMGLVGNKPTTTSSEQESNRRVVSGIAVLSLLILSVIANGSQYQTSFEQQKYSTIASYSAVI